MNHIISSYDVVSSAVRYYFPRRRLFPVVMLNHTEQYIANKMAAANSLYVTFDEDELCMIAAIVVREVCHCNDVHALPMWFSLMKHLLNEAVDIPITCYNVQCAFEYMLYEHKWPSFQDITHYQGRLERFIDDSNQYTSDESVVVTLDVSNVEYTTFESKDSNQLCTLCQEYIQCGQIVHELKCEHVFHGNAVDCLDSMGILDWFRTHRRCPNCNSEAISS